MIAIEAIDYRSRGLGYVTAGEIVATFLEQMFVQTKGEWGGEKLTLEEWQRVFLDEAFLMDPVTGLRVYSTVLLGLPAKNGKSTLIAGLMLYLLMADSVNGKLESSPEIYAIANTNRQAKQLFDQARETVIASRPLLARLEVLADLIWQDQKNRPPGAGHGKFGVLSAERSVDGINPSGVVVDELGGAKNGKMLAKVQKSGSSRRQLMTNIISHTGEERYGPLGDMYDEMMKHPLRETYGANPGEPLLHVVRDHAAGTLYVWYGLQDGYDPEDPYVWQQCNPASWKDEATMLKQRHLGGYSFTEFQRYDLNAWMDAEDVWIPDGAFVACGDPEMSIPRGADVWLGVDAARKDDCGAVAVCHPFVRPDGKVEYRLVTHILGHEPGAKSMNERLEDKIRQLDRRYKVQEVHYDPHIFVRSSDFLEDENLPMVEFPQSDARMCPASKLFKEAVLTRRLLFDADAELIRHVNGAVPKITDRDGERVHKKRARSKIDGAVASVMAVYATQNSIERGDWGKSKKVQIIPLG